MHATYGCCSVFFDSERLGATGDGATLFLCRCRNSVVRDDAARQRMCRLMECGEAERQAWT